MNQIKNKIEKLKKGCGTWSEGKKEGISFQTQCGNDGFKDQICLCEICIEKLQAYEEAQKIIDETLNDFCKELKEELVNNYGYYRGHSIIRIIDKLKKKHGGKQ